MAQLDTATYMPQVIWLLIVFISYNMIVKKEIAPTVSTILKVRGKKMKMVSSVEGGVEGKERYYEGMITRIVN